jgi:hypothetical protein
VEEIKDQLESLSLDLKGDQSLTEEAKALMIDLLYAYHYE